MSDLEDCAGAGMWSSSTGRFVNTDHGSGEGMYFGINLAWCFPGAAVENGRENQYQTGSERYRDYPSLADVTPVSVGRHRNACGATTQTLYGESAR